MYLPISCVDVPKSTKQKLLSTGYNYVEEVKHSKDAHTTSIWNDKRSQIHITSALQLFEDESAVRKIKTSCFSLDECLDGGVCCGRVLEVCGAPAQGKTQLCLQLCVCVQLPESAGGLDGQALFIDTAANFTAHRVKEIAEFYSEKFPNVTSLGWNSTVALEKVHYMQVLGTAKFLAAMFSLKMFLESNSQIKLVLIDNIATPFKDGCLEIDRIGILYRTMALLNELAWEKKIAVVITNEVNLRLGLEEEQVGALGDTWAHLTHRLLLAPPLLAMRHQCASSPIQIGRQGISDCAV